MHRQGTLGTLVSGRTLRRIGAPLVIAAFASIESSSANASDCSQTSVGLSPISDLGTALYLGQYQGGLYPNGVNFPPQAHAEAGFEISSAIAPLDVDGEPSASGRYVFLSMGMSNTTQEFCSQSSALPCDPWTFMGKALVHPHVNHDTLVMVNGAAGGQTTGTWDSPNDQNYDRVRDTRLIPLGLSEAQVQAVWIKLANAQPAISLPNANADAFTMLGQLGNVVRASKVRYPNLKIVFLSSRIYAGYASTALNPEPYAYESAFAVKWLIEAQIDQQASGGGEIDPIAGDLNYVGKNSVAPWLAWGPYLWADGLVPRNDGLTWQCADMQSDGTHPAQPGENKVGNLLLQFMMTSPFARTWFRAAGPGDVNHDDAVNVDDLLAVIDNWGPCPSPPSPANCPEDVAPAIGNGFVNVDDLMMVINNWS
jgi:hypothetical protein